jgi:hypothetical protein
MRCSLCVLLAVALAPAIARSAPSTPAAPTGAAPAEPERSGFTVEVSTGVGAVHGPGGSAGGPSLVNLQAGAFLTPRTAVGLRLATTSGLLETSDGDTLWFTATYLGLSVQRWLGARCFVSFGTGTLMASPSTDRLSSPSYDDVAVDLRVAYAHSLSRRISAFAAVEALAAISNDPLATTSLQLGVQVF